VAFLMCLLSFSNLPLRLLGLVTSHYNRLPGAAYCYLWKLAASKAVPGP